MADVASARPRIELLSFAGCPNHARALGLLDDVLGRLGLDAVPEVIDVPDQETATRMRFLGSPTIRVDGFDVEPGAERREDFVVACRVYRTDAGLQGLPDERRLVAALAHSSR
jgi:hypothetical protein